MSKINKVKEILNSSFWQLITIYTFILILVSFGFLSKYALQFNIFAIIIGLIGAFSLKINKSELKLNKKIHYILLGLALVLIIVLRIIPYLNNSVPLGYDPGIYKYGIEKGLENKDAWILQGGMEPGFLYLMQPLKLLFSTDFILKYVFIFFCALLGLEVYFLSKEYFNKTTALISLFLYAFSLIQFKTFWFLYYKNIIGLAFILFSLYFLTKYEKTGKPNNRIFFILLEGLAGAIHRPSFYIFGLSYFFYTFISPYSNSQKKYNKKLLLNNILSGILILMITILFYLGDFFPAITTILPWVAQGFISPGESPGTFMNFFNYQYSILPYFALSILGLFLALRIKKLRKLGILEIWALLNLSIVYFQFFFFNRFIIMLDLILIMLAAYGFSSLISQKKKLGAILVILLLICLGIFAFKESLNSQPLIDDIELQEIQNFNQTELNSYAMSTSSYYSTWLIGYSERKTIAPGLFDYDSSSKDEWIIFWTSSNLEEVKAFLNKYPKPLYIFIGKRQKDNLIQFNQINQTNQSNCFALYTENDNNKIYKYLC
jgi:hypothetical protein